MKENIKIGLLAIIAATVVIDTFFDSSDSERNSPSPEVAAVNAPASNISANPSPNAITPSVMTPPQPEPPKPTGPVTAIKFEKDEHDFGKVKQDTQNKFKFKFKNTGANPLIIENAVGSCGCTVPTFPKEPIAPGASGEIEVVYSPGKQKGQQQKTVTVTANTDPRETKVQIKADVEEIPAQ